MKYHTGTDSPQTLKANIGPSLWDGKLLRKVGPKLLSYRVHARILVSGSLHGGGIVRGATVATRTFPIRSPVVDFTAPELGISQENINYSYRIN